MHLEFLDYGCAINESFMQIFKNLGEKIPNLKHVWSYAFQIKDVQPVPPLENKTKKYMDIYISLSSLYLGARIHLGLVGKFCQIHLLINFQKSL